MRGEWVQKKGEEIFRDFFPGEWSPMGSGVYQGRCPGESFHSKGGAASDARIYCGYGANGQTPGIYCFHQACSGHLADLNEAFRSKLFEKTGERSSSGGKDSGVAPEPRGKRKPVNELYSEKLLRESVAGVEKVSPDWFIERSPVDPRGVMPGEFLNACFEEGERVLIFTDFYSQGQFAWIPGHGGRRLSSEPGVKSVKSALPIDGGKEGVWFLSNPVSMEWVANPRREGRMSRRSKESVTAWRYLVLESDDAPEDLWLKFLAKFSDPIRAIYSSGGKSWHALVAVNQSSWAAMDGLLRGDPAGKTGGARMGAKAYWSKYGADPGALTPVRLTRLPGCTRNGREQKLIYLNPAPLGSGHPCRPIVDMIPRRKL
jgi:hypothetical protein